MQQDLPSRRTDRWPSMCALRSDCGPKPNHRRCRIAKQRMMHFETYLATRTVPTWCVLGLLPLQRMSDAPAYPATLVGSPLLQVVGLTKLYGSFRANDAIDLDVFPRQIHALLGENGAGKSTLVKAIYGLIQPSEGELRWQGQKVVLPGPSAARALGIGMVFQHFSLFDNLTVAENVALGLDGKESFKAMSARLAEVSTAYGLPLDPRREVWRLSVGERQRIEIVRALMQDPKFLILDEPTAVLTPQEADQLFVVLARLKEEGRAILYISHKLDEVKRLCDTATILRGGKKVATCNPRNETAGLACAYDGRHQYQGRQATDRAANHCSAPRRQRPQHGVGRRARCPSEKRLARNQRWRDFGHRWRCGKRTGRIVRRIVRRTHAERRRQGRDRWPCGRKPQHHAASAAWCCLCPRRAARTRHRSAHAAIRQRPAHRSRGQRHGQTRLHRHGRNDQHGRSRDGYVRRPKSQARSGSGQPVWRKSAEIHRRARNFARARRVGRQPADMGRRCGGRRRHPPGAARSCGPRRGRARHQPGPSTN